MPPHAEDLLQDLGSREVIAVKVLELVFSSEKWDLFQDLFGNFKHYLLYLKISKRSFFLAPLIPSKYQHVTTEMHLYSNGREVRPQPREDQGQGGGRPRDPHVTVYEQMGLRERVNHEVTSKPEDCVDMAALWRHLAFEVFKDVVKAQLEPPVRAEGRKTWPFHDAGIKEGEDVAHATRGIAGEFAEAADGDFERNKSLRRIFHRCAIP
jgi:hypothetical protein